MSWTEAAVRAMREFDASRPRSMQTAVGWSEAGGCRSAIGFRLSGAWAADDPDTWAAQRGTAIHEYAGPILAKAFPGARIEIDTEYRGIPGHADLVDEASVTDLKGLALTTPIPTPSGWTTMSALSIGDEVFGSDGHPCRVVAKSAVKRIGTYIVRFKDGARIVCDREHLWWAMRGQGVRGRMEAVGVEEMAGSVIRRGQANWRVPVAEPLELPDADLPLSPYVLGCWLGDGSTGCGRISKDQEMFAEIEREGFQVGDPPPSQRDKVAPFRNVYGLMTLLRQLGVLHDKHVPGSYLRGSVGQRQSLLQGLMDSDGSWNRARNRCVFTNTSKVLAEAVFELAASVGERPHMACIARTGFGVTVDSYDVEWASTRFNPFRMPRKAARVAEAGPRKLARARWRTVSAIEPGPDVETACIGVDSPDKTYLCGHEMIPTHNTTSMANSRLWADDFSLLRPKRVQAHGYAAGLVDAGELPETCTVRLLVIPVDGTFADWWSYEELFDRSLADEGADRIEWVRARQDAGETLPKDKPFAWCESYCQFFSLCREPGEMHELAEITDPELAAAVARYGELTAEIGPREKEKKSLATMIRGLRGTANGWRVSTGQPGEDKEVPDMAAIEADYAETGRDVPQTWKPGNAPRLTVTRVKGAV